MDRFIATTPFFSPGHRTLAERVADLAEREVEVRAGDDEQDVDEAVRSYVMLLFEADLLRYAVAMPGQAFDLRSFCIIRETLSYSSSLADLYYDSFKVYLLQDSTLRAEELFKTIGGAVERSCVNGSWLGRHPAPIQPAP